jgi:ribonuclease R
MVGERTGTRYRLADRVAVQLTRVDMEQNKIDFRLAGTPVENPWARPAGKSSGKPAQKRPVKPSRGR